MINPPKPERHFMIPSEGYIQVYVVPAVGRIGQHFYHSYIGFHGTDGIDYTIEITDNESIADGQTGRVVWDDENKAPDSRRIVIANRYPDQSWYGSKPILLYTYSGGGTNEVIMELLAVRYQYPYRGRYNYLGPNCNTFTQYMIDRLNFPVTLPWRAVGRSYHRW